MRNSNIDGDGYIPADWQWSYMYTKDWDLLKSCSENFPLYTLRMSVKHTSSAWRILQCSINGRFLCWPFCCWFENSISANNFFIFQISWILSLQKGRYIGFRNLDGPNTEIKWGGTKLESPPWIQFCSSCSNSNCTSLNRIELELKL